MFHSIRARAASDLNANTYSYTYADANGYAYPNTNEHSDQYTRPDPYSNASDTSRSIQYPS